MPKNSCRVLLMLMSASHSSRAYPSRPGTGPNCTSRSPSRSGSSSIESLGLSPRSPATATRKSSPSSASAVTVRTNASGDLSNSQR